MGNSGWILKLVISSVTFAVDYMGSSSSVDARVSHWEGDYVDVDTQHGDGMGGQILREYKIKFIAPTINVDQEANSEVKAASQVEIYHGEDVIGKGKVEDSENIEVVMDPGDKYMG